MIKRAIAESEAHQAHERSQEEEKMMEAIRQSEAMLAKEQERRKQLKMLE